jgi:glycosyltransferase involved in cell wall biosynthesis
MHFEHDALAVRRLRSDLRQLRLLLRSVDAVHTHASWDTWLVAWARASLGSRPPMVRTRHNLKRIRSHGFNRWLYSRALTRLVAASHTIASDLARHAWIPQERVETIVDGIDLVAFDPRRHPRAEARSALRRRLGAPEDAPVVVYASRLSPRKRPELFVEAARRLGVAGSDAWFALAGPFAGDRAWRDSLSRSVESLGPRVQCLGFVEDVPGLLAGCDLFVLPADAHPEPAARRRAAATARSERPAPRGAALRPPAHDLRLPRPLRAAARRPRVSRRVSAAGAGQASPQGACLEWPGRWSGATSTQCVPR